MLKTVITKMNFLLASKLIVHNGKTLDKVLDSGSSRKMNLPVGSLWISSVELNMSDYFEGTWERYAKGRTIIGVNEDDADFASAGLELGEKKHTLTKAELPSYDLYNASHYHKQYYADRTGTVWIGGSSGEGWNGRTVSSRNTDGTTIKISSGGSNTPHNIIQPSITSYVYRRVS